MSARKCRKVPESVPECDHDQQSILLRKACESILYSCGRRAPFCHTNTRYGIRSKWSRNIYINKYTHIVLPRSRPLIPWNNRITFNVLLYQWTTQTSESFSRKPKLVHQSWPLRLRNGASYLICFCLVGLGRYLHLWPWESPSPIDNSVTRNYSTPVGQTPTIRTTIGKATYCSAPRTNGPECRYFVVRRSAKSGRS